MRSTTICARCKLTRIAGQVSFHSAKLVKKMSVTKSNEIVNRLNRTKKELYPDLALERQAYDNVIRTQRKSEVQAQKKAEKTAKTEAQQQQDLRSYKHLMQAWSLDFLLPSAHICHSEWCNLNTKFMCLLEHVLLAKSYLPRCSMHQKYSSIHRVKPESLMHQT